MWATGGQKTWWAQVVKRKYRIFKSVLESYTSFVREFHGKNVKAYE